MVPSSALTSSKIPVRSMVVHTKTPATTVTIPRPTDSRKEILNTDQASIFAMTSLARRALVLGAGRPSPCAVLLLPADRPQPLVGWAACVFLTVLLRLVGQYPRVPDLGRWILVLFRCRQLRRRLGRLRLRDHRFRS